MPISLAYQEKFTEKCFKKFYLPKSQLQLSDERFMDLLPYWTILESEPGLIESHEVEEPHYWTYC